MITIFKDTAALIVWFKRQASSSPSSVHVSTLLLLFSLDCLGLSLLRMVRLVYDNGQ